MVPLQSLPPVLLLGYPPRCQQPCRLLAMHAADFGVCRERLLSTTGQAGFRTPAVHLDLVQVALGEFLL